jgi:hypothetical protein
MRVTKNKHIAPVGYEWQLSTNWMSDKKIDCYRLFDNNGLECGAVKRGKGWTYINWDTGAEFSTRTDAMIDVESYL